MEIRKFVIYSLGLEIYTYERTKSALDAFFIINGVRVIHSYNNYIKAIFGLTMGPIQRFKI